MAKCSKFTSALLLLFCAFGSNLCDDPLDVLADLKPVDLSQGSPGSKDNSEAELHHITQPPPPPPPYQSLTGLGEKDSLPELPAGKLPEFAPEETKSKLAADKTSLTGTQSTESTSNLGHEMVDVNANEVPNQEDNNVNYSFDVLSSLGNAGQSLPPGANENKIQSWEDADDPGDVLSSVGDQSKNAASDTKTNAEGEPHPNIDVLSNLPAPSSYSAEPQSDKTEDRPDVLLDRLDVLQADSQPADLHPAYDQPETADNRKQDGGFKVSEYNPDSNSDNSRVGDEPSEPNVLHTVEIKLADVIPTHDAEKSASSNKPDEGNGMNTDSSSVSENTSSNQENDNLDSENDVETSFGNPPVLSNSDLRKIAKQIPTSLSPEEREKWQQNISNTLGLSAVDPGLAMLPRGQNSRTSPRTSTSTSSSTPFSWNSDADSTTAESSKPNSPVDKGQGMLNVIGNILKSNDNNHETGDEFQDDADVKNSLEDNFGRKVLTENEGEDEEDEDDRRYDSDYDYDNFFDEEEDYFGGGDVSKTSSSKSTNLENWKDEQAKNSKQSENRVDAVDEGGTSKQTTSNEEFAIGQDFEYEEDDDWYYNPEDHPYSDDMSILQTPATKLVSDPGLGNPPVDLVIDGNDNSESRTQIAAPEFKEGVINKEDVPAKRNLQAPQNTIILYTLLIIILIAGVVIFSVWKKPAKNGKPTHQTPVVRTGEEGKRLLDHPFV